jgi:hypothetical protein
MIEQIEPALCEIIITSYEGEKNKQNGCYEGQGKATFDTGCSYEGGFKNGMMHGTGTFKWPDGVVYEGDFVNGKVCYFSRLFDKTSNVLNVQSFICRCRCMVKASIRGQMVALTRVVSRMAREMEAMAYLHVLPAKFTMETG